MLGASERASERARQTAEGKTGSHLNRERSRYVTLRYVAMVAKFLELNKSRSCKYGKNKKPERY